MTRAGNESRAYMLADDPVIVMSDDSHDGMDDEENRLSRNAAFFDWLDRSIERAIRQKCKTIDEIEAELLSPQ